VDRPADISAPWPATGAGTASVTTADLAFFAGLASALTSGPGIWLACSSLVFATWQRFNSRHWSRPCTDSRPHRKSLKNQRKISPLRIINPAPRTTVYFDRFCEYLGEEFLKPKMKLLFFSNEYEGRCLSLVIFKIFFSGAYFFP
jgi:hypothetical protein